MAGEQSSPRRPEQGLFSAESPTAAAFRLLTDGEFEWALGELHNQAAAGGEEPQADTSGAALHPTASASNLAAAAAAAEQQQQQQAAAAAAAPQTAPAQATNSVSMAEATPSVSQAPSSQPGASSKGGAKRGPRPRLFKKFACQADACPSDLSTLSFYYHRNHICPAHLKADSFPVKGVPSRFCQRCGMGHAITEFSEGKRSCRKALERHNQRRRGRAAAAAAGNAGGGGPAASTAAGGSVAGSEGEDNKGPWEAGDFEDTSWMDAALSSLDALPDPEQGDSWAALPPRPTRQRTQQQPQPQAQQPQQAQQQEQAEMQPMLSGALSGAMSAVQSGQYAIQYVGGAQSAPMAVALQPGMQMVQVLPQMVMQNGIQYAVLPAPQMSAGPGQQWGQQPPQQAVMMVSLPQLPQLQPDGGGQPVQWVLVPQSMVAAPSQQPAMSVSVAQQPVEQQAPPLPLPDFYKPMPLMEDWEFDFGLGI